MKRRNPIAKAVKRIAPRIVKSRKVYTRKQKHKESNT